MPTSYTTPGLVLRRGNYSEYDRMVTLFTPKHGRVDAIARGCRKQNSPLQNASEPFTCGDFYLRQRGDRFSIEQCRISQDFFELRADYDRLQHGVYWLKLLELSVMPDVALEQLFLTTLRALAYLTYSDMPLEMMTMAFEMHLLAQLGFAPSMEFCRRCHHYINGEARFDAIGGCVTCPNCSANLPLISNGARRIMLKLPRTRYDQITLLQDHPDWKEAAQLYRAYINDRIGAGRFAPPLP